MNCVLNSLNIPSSPEEYYNMACGDNFSPELIDALYQNSDAMTAAVYANNKKLVNLLLAKGAKVTYSVLHVALTCAPGLFQHLWQEGKVEFDPVDCFNKGFDLVRDAIYPIYNFSNIEFLVTKGAVITQNAFDYATEYKDNKLMAYLVSHGFKPEIAYEPESNPEKQCKYCRRNKKDICFVPCGHISTCGRCAEGILKSDKKCLVCRTSIEKAIRTFTV